MEEFFNIRDLVTDLHNLLLRMDGVEQRISRLEDANVDLQEKVARLERCELARRDRRLKR